MNIKENDGIVKLKMTEFEFSVICSVLSHVRMGNGENSEVIFNLMSKVEDLFGPDRMTSIPVTCDVTIAHALFDNEFTLNV